MGRNTRHLRRLRWQLRIDVGSDNCDCDEIRGRRLPKTPLRATGLNFLATLGEEMHERRCVVILALRGIRRRLAEESRLLPIHFAPPQAPPRLGKSSFGGSVLARPQPIAAGLEEKSERFCRNGGAKWISRGNSSCVFGSSDNYDSVKSEPTRESGPAMGYELLDQQGSSHISHHRSCRNTTPSFITNDTSCRARRSSRGLAGMAMRSAARPGRMAPRSSERPIRSAALVVIILRA